jgi:hypothetical protein
MLAICLFTAFLVIRAAPDTLLGKALRRGLVDWPAEKLSRLTRGRLACWLGFGLALWAAGAIVGGDAARMMSMAMPETVAWLSMFDMSILADALIAAALIATQARLGAVKARLRSAPRRRGRRVCRPRARAPRRRRAATPKPDNDEEPAPAFAFAA